MFQSGIMCSWSKWKAFQLFVIFLNKDWFAREPSFQPPVKHLSVGLDVPRASIWFDPINAFGISPIKLLAFLFLCYVLLFPGTVENLQVTKWVMDFTT